MISLNVAVFGAALVLSFYRQYGFYKRLIITPVSETIYIAGLILSRFIILLIVINLFFLFSHLVFKFKPIGRIFEINIMLFVGTISLTSMSILLVSLGNNRSQIIRTANLLFFPMLFLGGTFFSLEHMPLVLKTIAYIFPYTYLVKGLNNIAVKGESIYQNGVELVVLLLWFIICFVYSIKRFQREEII